MVGRVSYLGRVKQGNYYTHVLYTIPNPNCTLPKPCPFIIIYPIHHPTLGTQTGRVSNRRKSTPPYIEYLPHLPHQRQLSVHTRTHPTIPFITYANLHFPTLFYCQGLIKYKAETIYQIRPKLPRTETTQAEPRPKRLRAEMTQVWNERPENAVTVVEQESTCRVVHLMIWLSILFGCEYSGLLIYLL